MPRPLIVALTLALSAQTSLACVLPPPMAAVFVQDDIKGQTWIIRHIDGLDLPSDDMKLTLHQSGELKVQALCNDITGDYRGDLARMELNPTLASNAFCDPAVERFDVELERSLRQVVGYSLDAATQTLTLTLQDQRKILLQTGQG